MESSQFRLWETTSVVSFFFMQPEDEACIEQGSSILTFFYPFLIVVFYKTFYL